MGRIAPVKYGGCREPASFGLSAFMGIKPKTCLDDAEFLLNSLGDMFTGFLMEDEQSLGGSSMEEDVGDDNDDEMMVSSEEKAAYWKKQHQHIEAAMRRSSSFEKKVRRDAAATLQDAQRSPVCICRKRAAVGGCRVCLQRDVVSRLREAGHDAAICKSRWSSSPDIPAGEHSYIDVIDTSGRAEDSTAARILVELEFRSEFEMARGSSDYNQLVGRLPEVFVGKPDRLKEVIKVACSAGKRCMKEKKMHLGPWRRHKYMHAKWFGAYERMQPLPIMSVHIFEEQHKKKTSTLTFDLSRNLSNFAVVEVL